MTKFFEPINASATHIYHSALELSPLSSIVRKLHYNRRPTPFPRVVAGTPDSWDPSVAISNTRLSSVSITWSPCGQFVAMRTKEAVEIWDTFTSGLHSTLQPNEPTSESRGTLVYSPDGRSIACVSGTAIIIWDIQTGGVVKGIQRDEADATSVVWSLDGRVIGTTQGAYAQNQIVCLYDVVSGTALSNIKLQPGDTSHIWAHGKSLRVAIIGREGEALVIEIFKVWPAFTKIESFRIESSGPCGMIGSFSPTTYRTSVAFSDGRFLVLDIRSSECLLAIEWPTQSTCFSPDGTFFAASSQTDDRIHIWKYTAGHYTPWREFQMQDPLSIDLQFSPTSSSILVHRWEVLLVWRLDIPPTSLSTHHPQLVAFSSLGAYIAAAKSNSSTLIITNLLSLAPFQLIDTGLEIWTLVLTDNILLTMGTTSTTAWLLTEEGMVDGVPGDRRAGPGDSIWTVPVGWGATGAFPEFLHEGQTGAIRDTSDSGTTHFYNTRTGEIIDSSPPPSHSANSWRGSTNILGWFHLRHRDLDERSDHAEDNWLVSKSTVQRGWVTDPAGKHVLWVPVEWRAFLIATWYYDITTLRLSFSPRESVVVKF